MDSDICYTPDTVAQICARALLGGYLRGGAGLCSGLDTVSNRPTIRALEPSIGGGAFVRAWNGAMLEYLGGVEAITPKTVWTGVDCAPTASGLAGVDNPIVGDFASLTNEALGLPPTPPPFMGKQPQPEKGDLFDVCIGNPPYSEAHEHILKGIRVSRFYAALLRVSFLEPTVDRYRDFYGPEAPFNPAVVFMLPTGFQRPKWLDEAGEVKHKNTDSVCSGLFVWDRLLCRAYRTIPNRGNTLYTGIKTVYMAPALAQPGNAWAKMGVD